MSGRPDTIWDREYRKRTQECIDAKAQVAKEPTPRTWPISGPDAKSHGLTRKWLAVKTLSEVETKE